MREECEGSDASDGGRNHEGAKGTKECGKRMGRGSTRMTRMGKEVERKPASYLTGLAAAASWSSSCRFHLAASSGLSQAV